MNLTITIIISYLLGCIPSAWLFGKIFLKKDIRSHGSGNVGAMNVYDISKSKMIFIFTFILDVGKGIAAVFAIQQLFGDDPYLIRMSAVFTVLGHNYNPFLGLKGGKGLATSVGVLASINPITIPMWIVIYFTSYAVIKKEVQLANVVACLGSFFLLIGLPEQGYDILNRIQTISSVEYKIMYFVIISIIISKHIKPLRKLYGEKD